MRSHLCLMFVVQWNVLFNLSIWQLSRHYYYTIETLAWHISWSYVYSDFMCRMSSSASKMHALHRRSNRRRDLLLICLSSCHCMFWWFNIYCNITLECSQVFIKCTHRNKRPSIHLLRWVCLVNCYWLVVEW